MNNANNPNIQSIQELLLRKLDIIKQAKVMSLSPMDNDITSISHMLSERQNYLDEVETVDKEINLLVTVLSISDRNYIKSILLQNDIPNNLPEYLLDMDNVVKNIYNEMKEILVANRELHQKLNFIKDNLVMQIKQINNNNQIFKYSSGTLGITPGSVMDKKQ